MPGIFGPARELYFTTSGVSLWHLLKEVNMAPIFPSEMRLWRNEKPCVKKVSWPAIQPFVLFPLALPLSLHAHSLLRPSLVCFCCLHPLLLCSSPSRVKVCFITHIRARTVHLAHSFSLASLNPSPSVSAYISTDLSVWRSLKEPRS